MNEGHLLEFRQKVASFDKDEVKIACDILAACHPADYLNALVRNYKRLITSHEAAGSIFKQFQEEHDILIGKKIPEENFGKTFVEVPGEKDHPELALKGFEGNETEDIKPEEYIPKKMETKSIEIPDFLKQRLC